MTTPAETLVVRRILVALDASASSLAALEAAAEMAARLHAELAGLFVEEDDLLRLAALPFARAYSTDAADLAHLDVEAMRRALRVQGERARRALEDTAMRHRLPWSFRVAQGAIAVALAEAARECDLLGLGAASGAWTRHARLGSTTRAALGARGCAILVLSHAGALGARAVALYTGADRLLDAAAQLAGGLGIRLDAIAIAPDPSGAEALRRRIEDWRAHSGRPLTASALVANDTASIARAVEQGGRGLVMAAPDGLLARPGQLEALIEALDLPFLLLR